MMREEIAKLKVYMDGDNKRRKEENRRMEIMEETNKRLEERIKDLIQKQDKTDMRVEVNEKCSKKIFERINERIKEVRIEREVNFGKNVVVENARQEEEKEGEDVNSVEIKMKNEEIRKKDKSAWVEREDEENMRRIQVEEMQSKCNQQTQGEMEVEIDQRGSEIEDGMHEGKKQVMIKKEYEALKARIEEIDEVQRTCMASVCKSFRVQMFFSRKVPNFTVFSAVSLKQNREEKKVLVLNVYN